jgi:hypothetical protein
MKLKIICALGLFILITFYLPVCFCEEDVWADDPGPPPSPPPSVGGEAFIISNARTGSRFPGILVLLGPIVMVMLGLIRYRKSIQHFP